MSQLTHGQTNMSDLKNRMKARLALANFKVEYGYSNIDLRTLESTLYSDKLQPKQDKLRKNKLISHHRFYPTSPPTDRKIIKHNASRSHVPLSEIRQHLSSHRKLSLTFSSDDEDAAHLLVLMHRSPTMS